MFKSPLLILVTTLLATSMTQAHADVKVVASIKPVHSLVAAVMEGVGKPSLIIEGAGSPHTYALKPSQASALEKADLVFWVGHQLEAFLEKPIKTIASKATAVELIDAKGLIKLHLREGGGFEVHDHDEREKHDDHDNKNEKHDKHGYEESDIHVWLDPVNAKAIVETIKEALVKRDADNTAKYEANAKSLIVKLDAVTNEIANDLKPVTGKGFIVFHDAYQYFEKRFGLKASGSITVSPEVIPGAKRIGEIQAKVKKLGATCVFSEPQFQPKLVGTVTENTLSKTGALDPLGATLKAGPELYFNLLRSMATSFKTCLSKAS